MNNAAITALLFQHFAFPSDNAQLVVVGLGITGTSVARYLQKLGIAFRMVDSRVQPPALAEFIKAYPNTPVLTGELSDAALAGATHLIVSPGVSLAEPAIQNALANGVQLLSDIDLFACSTAAPIVAITGSNGKSTVTTMLGEMASAAGQRVGVGGNLGTPALDLLDEAMDLYVLELSSFQLERTTLLNAAAATVLNLSADHLDRHADMSDYAHEKQRVFAGNGVMVLNADDAVVIAMREPTRQTVTFSVCHCGGDFNRPVNELATKVSPTVDFYLADQDGVDYLMHGQQALMALSELPLEGRHNAANALAALALGTALNLNTQAMCAALKVFQGLPHRMHKVAQVRGVNWVNDSKATNIGACVAALAGYTQKVILIAGGDGKGADMNELKPIVQEKAKAVVLMGKDAPLIAQALNDCVPIAHADNMLQAVERAAEFAQVGDTVLLSPACASLDQYKSYADRGEQFARAVLSLPS
jgi:UDP-N-acetylmuramoylalanine--D-glutamate ligase